MNKPDISIYESEFINCELFGHHIFYDPMVKVLQKANELGMEGKKIVEVMHMEGFDMDRMTRRTDFYFKTVIEKPDEVVHGNGD